jgi:hypothetical protein
MAAAEPKIFLDTVIFYLLWGGGGAICAQGYFGFVN